MIKLPCIAHGFVPKENFLENIAGIYLSTGISLKDYSAYLTLLSHAGDLNENLDFSAENIEAVACSVKPFCKALDGVRKDSTALIVDTPCVVCTYGKNYMNARRDSERRLLYAVLQSSVLPHDMPVENIGSVFSSYDCLKVTGKKPLFIKFNCMLASALTYYSSIDPDVTAETIKLWILSLYEGELCKECSTEEEFNAVRSALQDLINGFLKNQVSVSSSAAFELINELRIPYGETKRVLTDSGKLPQRQPVKISAARKKELSQNRINTSLDKDIVASICAELGADAFSDLQNTTNSLLGKSNTPTEQLDFPVKSSDIASDCENFLPDDNIPSVDTAADAELLDAEDDVSFADADSDDVSISSEAFDEKNALPNSDNEGTVSTTTCEKEIETNTISLFNRGRGAYFHVRELLLSGICINIFTIPNIEVTAARNTVVAVEIFERDNNTYCVLYFPEGDKYYYHAGTNISGSVSRILRTFVLITSDSSALYRFAGKCGIRLSDVVYDLSILYGTLSVGMESIELLSPVVCQESGALAAMRCYLTDRDLLECCVRRDDSYCEYRRRLCMCLAVYAACLPEEAPAPIFNPLVGSIQFTEKSDIKSEYVCITVDNSGVYDIYYDIVVALVKSSLWWKKKLVLLGLDSNGLLIGSLATLWIEDTKDIFWNTVSRVCHRFNVDAPQIYLTYPNSTVF